MKGLTSHEAFVTGDEQRRIGNVFHGRYAAQRIFFLECGATPGAMKLPSIGVIVRPGEIVLARIPNWPNSLATVRVTWFMPAFAPM